MSQTGSRIINAGKTHSTELIMFPLFIILAIGIIANNMQAGGIQTNPSFVSNTQTAQGACNSLGCVGQVYPQNSNGCDANPNNCNISKVSAFNFIGTNNPFSFLLSGNLLGFFSCLAGCPQITPTSNLIFLAGCTNFEGTVDTTPFITSLYCFEGTFNSPNNVPLAPYNSTSAVGNNSNWFIQGITAPAINVYAIYKANGSTFYNTYCDAVGICYNTPVYTCPTIHQSPFNGTNVQYCLDYVIISSASPNFTNTFGVFSFVIGIVLLFLSFGLTIALSVAASGTTIGINSQGTRQAGVLGFGLLLFGFVLGTFGGWMNFLGLGVGAILGITFTLVFFLGLYWRLFSLD